MTRSELLARYPNASSDFIRRNADDRAAGIPAVASQPDPRVPLDRSPKRKDAGGRRPSQRTQITFRVFSVRPCDWDNAFTKPLQDLLIEAGLIPGDAWHQLYGCVVSEKVHRKEEEKTVIEITPP